jgi:hypothetical protein
MFRTSYVHHQEDYVVHATLDVMFCTEHILQSDTLFEYMHEKQYIRLHVQYMGTVVPQWLRYYVTNQKVAGSIPDGVLKFFIDLNPSDRTMALG